MPPRDPDERELEAVRGADGGDDLDVLRRLGEAARSVTDADAVLDEPPPGLWDRIAAAAGKSPAPPAADLEAASEPANGAHRPAPTADAPEPPASSAATPDAWPENRGRPSPAAVSGSPASPPAGAHPPAGPAERLGAQVPEVASIGAARQRRRAPAWVLAAAAAVVVLVVGAVSLALTGGGDEKTVVAAARLEPLAAAEPATAELVEADGHLQLDLPLSTADLPSTNGFYEVWLIDTDVQRLISLGPVRPDASYAVPGDIDYRDFPIIDVSVEPPDGDPTHSGESILRGTLS
jgi:hypothetical protein